MQNHPFVQSEVLNRLPGIVHGFGTQLEPIPSPFLPLWHSHRPSHKQVHQVGIAKVERPNQELGEVDGLFSHEQSIPIGVMTADCVPILLANKSGKVVAAVHAGWRGTRAGIIRALWNQLQAEGETPENWVATIGPAIGPCCYEVSTELAEDFLAHFSDFPAHRVSPKPRMLDLPAINAEELRRIGLNEIEILRHCTRCSDHPHFHSYRREGGGTRQWSVIMRSFT